MFLHVSSSLDQAGRFEEVILFQSVSAVGGGRDALRLVAGDYHAFENWFLQVHAVTLVLGSAGVLLSG